MFTDAGGPAHRGHVVLGCIRKVAGSEPAASSVICFKLWLLLLFEMMQKPPKGTWTAEVRG